MLIRISLLMLFLLAAAVPASACWVDEKGPCRQCGGTGATSCQYCSSGTKNCGYCFGSGSVTVTCPGCNGSGKIDETTCGSCGGAGKINQACDGCGGTGRITCGTCGGSGQVTCFFCGGSGETVVARRWDENCGRDHGQQEVMYEKGVTPPPAAPVLVFLRSIPGDANLNGEVVQVALGGGDPTVLLRAVEAFYPQTDGAILGSRRTSRSGHDLIHRAPGGQETVLASAFYFGAAASHGDRWAAFRRPAVGGGWDVALGVVGGAVEYRALPGAGKPGAIAWTADGPVVQWGGQWLQPSDSGWKPVQHTAGDPFMLNKSERLQVSQDGDSVKLSRVWFTGDEKPVASLRGTLIACELTPDLSTALVTVRDGDVRSGWLVNVHSGEKRQVVPKADSAVLLLPAPE